IARGAGRKVALSLSDSFCVGRYRDEFRALIEDHNDIVNANDAEIMALYETTDLAAATQAISASAGIAAITLGKEGSLIVSGGDRIAVPAAPVARVVDTTGAGDLYAAGVLHGLARGLPLAECGRLGSIAAGEVISHFGARPETALASLI
ncbi:MAG: adenosine kinase, partial [Rhizorhabdus sp.]|nr:adenosine kinase [Rhizorhabdus sp.]